MSYATATDTTQNRRGLRLPCQPRCLILVVTLLLSAHAAKAVAVGFTSPAYYRVGTTPVAAATGDFNRDGNRDLAVANSGSSTVTILFGSGTGSFQSTVRTYTVPQSPRALAVGDFNRDGFLDIVLTAGGSIVVVPGRGDGTFGASITSSGEQQFGDLAVRDFNGDSRLDLAVTDGPNVSILLGRGDGTFQPPVFYATGWNAQSVAIGDFNHDGRPDLVLGTDVMNYIYQPYPYRTLILTGRVTLLFGNGDGTFRSGVSYAVGGRPLSVAVDDFNRDGVLDLAVAVRPSTNLTKPDYSTALSHLDTRK